MMGEHIDETEQLFRNLDLVRAVMAEGNVPQASSTTSGYQCKGMVDGNGEIRPGMIRLIITEGPGQPADSGDEQRDSSYRAIVERDGMVLRAKAALQSDARWSFEESAEGFVINMNVPAPRYPLSDQEQAGLNLWSIVYIDVFQPERNLVRAGRADLVGSV